MLELPRMLQLPRIERLYDFLERDYAEAKKIEEQLAASLAHGEKQFKHTFLNFEDFLNHPDLPPFASEPISYHMKERFKDFHNSEQEVIREVVDKDPYMTWGVQNFKEDPYAPKKPTVEKNIEVEHSAIDFQKVIIGEKVRNVLEHGFRHVNFNDQHLARIIYVEEDEHI